MKVFLNAVPDKLFVEDTGLHLRFRRSLDQLEAGVHYHLHTLHER